MAQEKTDNWSGTGELTAKNLRHFLDEEITMVTKGAELRIRELTQLATAYAAGEITPEEANKRFEVYQDKWGPALPGGLMMAQGVSDKELMEVIDRAAADVGPFTSRQQPRDRNRRPPETRDGSPEVGR